MTASTLDDLLAAQDALVAEIGDGVMSDEQETRYTELETQVTARRKTDEILKRHAAVKAAAPGQFLTGAAPKEDKTLDRAFGHWLRTGKENADLVELRAGQTEGTATEGGFLVPDTFRADLIRRLKAFGGVASEAQEINTGDGRPVSWPTVDDVGNVGEIVSEGGTFSAGADIVFGTAQLGAYRYATGGASATPVRVSVELLQDSAFDVEGLVSSLLAERIGRIQATHLVTGTGISQPKGLVTGLTGTASAASTLAYGDFVGYIHAVDPAYRDDTCVWAMNDTSLKTIRKILDSSNRPILKGVDDAALETSAGGERLLGYRVVVDQAFSNIAANSTTNWGAFGNLRAGYVVRRVRDVVLAVDPYGRMANGQVQYTAWARLDATQQNTNAYTALTAHS